MNLTSSHPFWSVNNGLPANYPSLRRDVSCDAVIIGGGITGALVAVHLVEAGVKTLLIDKRDIGTGSTSASTALLQYEIDVPLRELTRKVGPATAMRSYQLCRESIGKLERLAARLKIDCGFERKPSVFLARYQREISELREEFQLRRKMGIQLEFFDAVEVRKRFPFSRPAALFSQDGAQVDPHRLTHGLLAAGQRAGLEVCDRTEMARLEQTRRGRSHHDEGGVPDCSATSCDRGGVRVQSSLERGCRNLEEHLRAHQRAAPDDFRLASTVPHLGQRLALPVSANHQRRARHRRRRRRRLCEWKAA